MASPDRRRAENAPGDFFVDDTCIDCATCRWVAPETFAAREGQSAAVAQPGEPELVQRALMAVVACPTASIGFTDKHTIAVARDAFPDPVTGRALHCGFHAESSFGAAAWLYVRDGGNVLIDSPRFNDGLADRVEALGPVKYMFLTHRDDVADHEKWARRLGCERVMHEDDVTAGTRGVERQLEGEVPVSLEDDLLVIPVPGHTRGSAVLLAGGDHLFTGDHLAWRDDHLYAFRRACWYSWPEQIESMARMVSLLEDHAVAHVIPGHGRRVSLPPDEMRAALAAVVPWMRER
jgi:glyoxylase-like metal-dependent hydrolase (beta-lactamase superfamily II)